jgi:glycosyltransferase involved in cell wall biosynthesis
MRSLAFVIPGDLETRTGGYEYDRRIIDGLRQLGWVVGVHLLDASFPQPTAAALAGAESTLAGLADGTRVLLDGLALGAMPEIVRRHATRLRLLALVHHPLAWETGLPAALATRLRDSEREALAAVNHVVVTSPPTAAGLAEYDIAPDRISVVEPGTDAAPLARGSHSEQVHLLCVGSVSPRKGHAVLIAALAALRAHPWHLTCVGDLTRHWETVDQLTALSRASGIEDRVAFVGEAGAEAVAAFYDRSDLFVLPTFYEGYGMVIGEALARGLPVVSTPTGAIAGLVNADAGLLVAAGDVDGWIQALRKMFDPAVRDRFARGARARRDTLPTWRTASEQMAVTLMRHG